MSNMQKKSVQGAVMVEFAIILPVLVLLVFGITELGRALYQWNTLTKAVATGARYMARANGVLDATNCDDNDAWDNHEEHAKYLIVYGQLTEGTVPLLPELDNVPVINELEDELNYILIKPRVGEEGIYGDACVIVVEAAVPFDWIVGPLIPYNFVGGPITLTARTEERYIGE